MDFRASSRACGLLDRGICDTGIVSVFERPRQTASRRPFFSMLPILR
jgi:hypothetical protein